MTIEDLRKALVAYNADLERSRKNLARLSAEAEESGDYYDFDQASYDHNEYGTELGESLARAVREYIDADWGVK